MGTTTLATDSSAGIPSYIVIPGTKRPTSRRTASNPGSGIKAMIIPDKDTKISTKLKVSLMRDNRVLYQTLSGHEAAIVDLEFLQTPPFTPIHVLGSCDRDGVVFLWFLYVAKDKLGIDINLQLLKKYSFFTLRRSTTAFYWRIRLAGTVHDGTMVLVPNDGANVRVVTFHCEPEILDNGTPLVTAEEKPALPAPPLVSIDARDGAHSMTGEEQDANGDDETTETGDLPSDGGAPYVGIGADAERDGSYHEQDARDDELPNQQRNSIGLEDLAARSAAAAMTFEASGQPVGDEALREHGVSSRSTMNSSVVMARADGTAGGDVDDDFTDDLAEAAAVAAGVPSTHMEGALAPADSIPIRTTVPPLDDDDDRGLGSDDEFDAQQLHPLQHRDEQMNSLELGEHDVDYEAEAEDDGDDDDYDDDDDVDDDNANDRLHHDRLVDTESDFKDALSDPLPHVPLQPARPQEPQEQRHFPTDSLIVEGEGLAPSDYSRP